MGKERKLSVKGIIRKAVIVAIILHRASAAAQPLADPVASASSHGAGMEVGLVPDVGHDAARGGDIEAKRVRQIEESCFLIALCPRRQRRNN